MDRVEFFFRLLTKEKIKATKHGFIVTLAIFPTLSETIQKNFHR
jgi:hypothetical protein